MQTPTGLRSRRQRTPGIQLLERPDRSMPFVARWYEGDTRRSKAFARKSDRDAFASELGKIRSAGETVPVNQRVWEEFCRLTEGADPIAVAQFWADAHQPVPLGEAIKTYSAALEGQTRSRDTVTHRDLHLARLEAFLGASRSVASVTPKDLRSWLAGLRNDLGEPMAPKSLRHHRANAHRLWQWLVAERMCARNPVEAVAVPDEPDDEINLLTLEQAQHLFAVNRGHLSAGRMALEAFGGLRFTSAARLKREDLQVETKGIVMPAKAHKSGRRQFVENLPENLWAWVAAAPEACWDVHPRNYADHKRRMFAAAGLKGEGKDEEAMRNVLRHSFASYHVAAYSDAAKTALILTHRNQSMLWRHYRGRATQADGNLYFGILPT